MIRRKQNVRWIRPTKGKVPFSLLFASTRSFKLGSNVAQSSGSGPAACTSFKVMLSMPPVGSAPQRTTGRHDVQLSSKGPCKGSGKVAPMASRLARRSSPCCVTLRPPAFAGPVAEARRNGWQHSASMETRSSRERRCSRRPIESTLNPAALITQARRKFNATGLNLVNRPRFAHELQLQLHLLKSGSVGQLPCTRVIDTLKCGSSGEAGEAVALRFRPHVVTLRAEGTFPPDFCTVKKLSTASTSVALLLGKDVSCMGSAAKFGTSQAHAMCASEQIVLLQSYPLLK
eukprot:350266-Chlamydomonas_euryale.AAC.14